MIKVRKDLTGQVFGKLKVIEVSGSKNRKAIWLCECECGNFCNVYGYSLISGNTKTCGCSRNAQNLKNKKFGMLTVIDRAEDYIPASGVPKVRWNCVCDCGNTTVVNAYNLTHNVVTSCGCRNSKGEKKIEDYLRNNNIQYERQKTFDGCKNQINLRFDFYLPKYDMCIEYDGIQHFQPVDFAGKGNEWAKDRFLETQENDKLKDEYCLAHKIKIVRIPYTDFDNIEMILREKLS